MSGATAPLQLAIQAIGSDLSVAISGGVSDVSLWYQQLALALVPDPRDATSIQVAGAAPDGQAAVSMPVVAAQTAAQALAASPASQPAAVAIQPGSGVSVSPEGMPMPAPTTADTFVAQTEVQASLPPPTAVASPDGLTTVPTGYMGALGLVQQPATAGTLPESNTPQAPAPLPVAVAPPGGGQLQAGDPGAQVMDQQSATTDAGQLDVASPSMSPGPGAQMPASVAGQLPVGVAQSAVTAVPSSAGSSLAGMVPLTDLSPAGAPVSGIAAVASPDGEPLLLARTAESGDMPPQSAVFPFGPGLSLGLIGAGSGVPQQVRIDWQGERFWPLLAQPLAQAAGSITVATRDQQPVQAVSLEFGLRMGGAEVVEPPTGALRFANGATVVLGQPVPAEGPRLERIATPTAARVAVHLEAEKGRTSPRASYAVCEPGGTVPLDLAPAQVQPLWRLDDTRCFATIGREGVLPAIAAAATLHRRLATHEIGLADLQPGEGFDTWEGSPLWLVLAGIAKPPTLGVALSESRPQRVEVWREMDGGWLVHRDGVAHRFDSDASDDAALFQCTLFGVTPGTDMHAYTQASAAMARAQRAHRVANAAARAEEAWAAVARYAAGTASDDGLLAALLPGSAWQRLEEFGDTVLSRIANGDPHTIDRADGIALAVRLGRLRPEDLMETVEE